MRRVMGLVLFGLGVALVLLAPLLHFYAVPRLAVAPMVVDSTKPDGVSISENEGTVDEIVDLRPGSATLGQPRYDVPVMSIRRTKGDPVASDQAGGNIGVYDSFSVISDHAEADGSRPPYLPPTNERFAFDRTTDVMAVGSGSNVNGTPITAAMIGNDTLMPLKMPFFTEQKDYSMFDDTLMTGVPTKFMAVEDRDGLTVYRFEQNIPATQAGTNQGQPQFYQNHQVFWAEPTTGQIVDGYQDVKVWLKNADGSDGTTILQGKIGFTPQNVADSTASAKDNAAKLKLVNTTLPIACLVGGLVLLGLGLWLALGARRAEPEVYVPSEPLRL